MPAGPARSPELSPMIALRGEYELLQLMAELDYSQPGHTDLSELVDLEQEALSFGWTSFEVTVSLLSIAHPFSELGGLVGQGGDWARYRELLNRESEYFGHRLQQQPRPRGSLV